MAQENFVIAKSGNSKEITGIRKLSQQGTLIILNNG